MNVNFRLLSVLAGMALVFALGGCSRTDDEGHGSLLGSETTLLRYVPADSPYVLANVRPFPDELLDRLEPRLEPVFEAYQAILRQTIATALEEAGGDEADAAEQERMAAIVTEMSTLLSIDGLKEVGIDRESTMVFYGHGLLPVFRMALTDGALLEARIARIEERAGRALERQAVGEQEIRFIEAEQARVLVAIIDDQLVVTFAPLAFDEDQLRRLLGLTPPASSIADSGRLVELAETYGYADYLVGYADIVALVETFVGEPTGLNADLLAATGLDAMRAQLGDACREDFRAIAGIAPRVVTGYTEVTASAIESHAIVEVRSDLAAGLASLPAAVPGLGSDPGGLASFGLSLDVRAARTFYEARLDALEADPYECELMAPLQLGIAAGRQVLQQPVPPMIYDFRGLLGVVTAMEGMDFERNLPPTRIDGRLMLSMDNAPAFLALGQMFSPELASLQIEPNGQPVALDLPQLAVVTESAHLALTEHALALAAGRNEAAALDGMLSAAPAGEGTLLSVGMDAGRYYGFLGTAVMAEAGEDGEELPPEVRDSVNRMMTAFSELYDRIWSTVRLNARGVEMESTVTIKE